MKKRTASILTNILAVVVVVAALAFFGTTLYRALVIPPPEPEAPTPRNESSRLLAASSSLPARLIIPSLGVNAHVQNVGVSKRGTMAVPTNYTDVGWYKYGAIPGRVGNAVMAGHLDNGFGTPAVFKKLGDLQSGDEIIVEDAQGTRLHFMVTDTGAVSAGTRDTNAVFQSSSQAANLNLITCEGVWDPKTKMYSERRVVFTTLTRIEPPQS